MLGSIAKYVKDVSVLRRLLFAVAYLPPDLPNIWGVAVEFATRGKESRNSISADQAQLFSDNLRTLDVAAFETDDSVLSELIAFKVMCPIIKIYSLIQCYCNKEMNVCCKHIRILM